MLAQHEKASIYRAMQRIQDPGNLEADLQAGGFAGYALLWLFLVCTIMVSAFNCDNLIWHLLLLLSYFSAYLAAAATAMCYNAQCNAVVKLVFVLAWGLPTPSTSHHNHVSQIQSACRVLSAVECFSLSASLWPAQSNSTSLGFTARQKGVDAAEYAVQGFAFQCLSSRLGIATGLNLAQHCGQEYPKLPRYLMWFCMEIAIIGADIQEVIGSAIAIALLSNNVIPLWAGVHAVSLSPFEPGGMLYLLQHGTAVWLYGLQCLPCFGWSCVSYL